MMTRTPRIMVLLSIAQHPQTGRLHRADLDARALELALSTTGAEVLPVHAGSASREALRGYLGMGLPQLTVLESATEANVCSSILQHIRASQPHLVLCGVRAQAGEGSGYLPYVLAHELGWPLAANISRFGIAKDEIHLESALTRGRRRELIGELPLIATVSGAAARARQSAFGRAQRARIDVLRYSNAPPRPSAIAWQVRPARARPKRLKGMSANLAGEELLKALTDSSTKSGEVLSGLSAPEAAERIIEYLRSHNML